MFQERRSKSWHGGTQSPSSLRLGLPRRRSSGWRGCDFGLFLLLKGFDNLLHPCPVRTQVGIADPGRRAEVDDLPIPIHEKLDIIDEAKDQTRRLCVDVSIFRSNDLHSW